MKPTVLFGAGLLLLSGLLAVASPAGEQAHERIVKEMLETMEQITKVLTGITNQDSAAAAAPNLKKAAEKMLQLRMEAAELKQPDKAEKDRLAKEYAPKMELAVKEMRKQTIRVKGIPGGDEAVMELAVLNEKKDAKDKKKSDQ